MPFEPSQNQTSNLETLARGRFADLTAAEIKLLRAAPTGDAPLCGPGVSAAGPAYDPSKGSEWGREREIRADLIHWLCVNRQAKELVDPRGIKLWGAKIHGKIDLSNVSGVFPLRLWKCLLTDDLTLVGAELAALDFQGSWVRSIIADGALIKSDLLFREHFHSGAEVRLMSAQIIGDLDCTGSSFENPPQEGVEGTGKALSADGVIIKGSALLRGGFSAKGEVRLLGAQIENNLDCNGGSFENPPQTGGSGWALVADRATINGAVFLNHGFRANGLVYLPGAKIGSNLQCEDGTFENPTLPGVIGSGWALIASEIQIGGDLFCINSTFANGLTLENALIKGGLFWKNIVHADKVSLNLMGVSVDSLADDAKSWPAAGNLQLDGFVYKRFSNDAPTDAKSRLNWLARQQSFSSRPYQQLASVLRDSGDDDSAKKVLVEMQSRLHSTDSLVERPLDWLYSVIGYGYYPTRAIYLLGVLAGLGWFINRKRLLGSMSPIDKEAYEAYKKSGALPPHYPSFSPAIYSLENSLPIVKLGQTDRWQPDPHADHDVGGGRWLRRFLWLQIILGWILTTLFVAGITGLILR